MGTAITSEPNGTPGASIWTTGLAAAKAEGQEGLLAGLGPLAQDGRQDPLGLQTDFAVNRALASLHDGTSLSGYARQRPLMRSDAKGLLPTGRMTRTPSLNSVEQCIDAPSELLDEMSSYRSRGGDRCWGLTLLK